MHIPNGIPERDSQNQTRNHPAATKELTMDTKPIQIRWSHSSREGRKPRRSLGGRRPGRQVLWRKPRQHSIFIQKNGHTKRVVDTKVETTVDNDTDDGGNKTTVEPSDTIRSKSFLVDIYKTVELTLPAASDSDES